MTLGDGGNGNAPIVCLAGKPPRPGTVLDLLVTGLASGSHPVTVELPDVTGVAAERWPGRALIVHRGLSSQVLRQLADVERGGRAFCNPVAASLVARDRPTLLRSLRGAGLPVPAFERHEDWSAILTVAKRREIVVKAVDGAAGRGSRVLFSHEGQLPSAPPFAGPYLVEDRIVHDGTDRKLYVAGSRCFGLLKIWPRTRDDTAAAFDPGEELRLLARAAGRASGLEIYGVDVVVGPNGPVIVDLNVFPGFRGVAGAADAVVDHVRRRVAGIARD